MANIASEAIAVFELMNADLYAVQLEALQFAAEKNGLEFVTRDDPRPFQLTTGERETLAAAVASARRIYLMPKIDEFQLQGLQASDSKDGYATAMLDSLLAALRKRQINLQRPVGTPSDVEPSNTLPDFTALMVGRLLLMIEAIGKSENKHHSAHFFGLAIGYQIALGELGIISGKLREDLVYEAEVIYNSFGDVQLAPTGVR